MFQPTGIRNPSIGPRGRTLNRTPLPTIHFTEYLKFNQDKRKKEMRYYLELLGYGKHSEPYYIRDTKERPGDISVYFPDYRWKPEDDSNDYGSQNDSKKTTAKKSNVMLTTDEDDGGTEKSHIQPSPTKDPQKRRRGYCSYSIPPAPKRQKLLSTKTHVHTTTKGTCYAIPRDLLSRYHEHLRQRRHIIQRDALIKQVTKISNVTARYLPKEYHINYKTSLLPPEEAYFYIPLESISSMVHFIECLRHNNFQSHWHGHQAYVKKREEYSPNSVACFTTEGFAGVNTVYGGVKTQTSHVAPGVKTLWERRARLKEGRSICRPSRLRICQTIVTSGLSARMEISMEELEA